LEATNEEQQSFDAVQTQRVARLGPVARSEEGVFHAEWYDVHPLAVRFIELDELLRLDVTTGEHCVSAREDRCLLEGALSDSDSKWSALTLSRVWNVMMSGMFNSCFNR